MENVWPDWSSSGFEENIPSAPWAARVTPSPVPRSQGLPDPAQRLQETFGCSWEKGRSIGAHQGMVLVVFAKLHLKLYNSNSASKPPHPGSAPPLPPPDCSQFQELLPSPISMGCFPLPFPWAFSLSHFHGLFLSPISMGCSLPG